MTNLFSWELILFLFFFFIYMLLVFWQKRKWSELDKLNKDQEVKFVTYVNGMYFFGFILSVFYLSLSFGSNLKELFFLYDFFSCFKLTHLSCILCNENLRNMLTQVGSYIYACKDQCL